MAELFYLVSNLTISNHKINYLLILYIYVIIQIISIKLLYYFKDKNINLLKLVKIY